MSKIIANQDFENNQKYFYQRHRKLFKKEKFCKNTHKIHNYEEYALNKDNWALNFSRSKLNRRFTKQTEIDAVQEMLEEFFK